MLTRITVLLSTVILVVAALVFARNIPEDAELHRVKRWEEMPNVTFTFDCSGKSVGFYADLEFDCNIFHMCDEDGRRIPHICANNTAFNQKYRVCDWLYNVDCKNSPNWYYLNDLTYETDPPVIDQKKQK